MNVTCKDRDRIFEDGTPAEWAALEAHAASCAECGEEVRAWKSLSVAAEELRDYTPDPTLWQNIQRALIELDARKAERKRWLSFLPAFPLAWQTALAGAFLLVLTISGAWVIINRPTPPKPGPHDGDKSLLKSSALNEVETAEAAYEKAIDKLAAQAKPQLDTPATPLLASYHEKLLVLDGAISELRAQAGMNPARAQLRYQLLAMFQEKQKTLEEVLEVKK